MTELRMHSMKALYNNLIVSHPSLTRVVRFAVSGGTATFVNLSVLYFLTRYAGVWYIYSSVLAFGVAFLISFTLQKIWTFENTALDRVHIQAVLFLFVILIALGVNTALVYLLVEFAGMHYLLAQLLSGLCVAVLNFFGYKHLVFRGSDVEKSL